MYGRVRSSSYREPRELKSKIKVSRYFHTLITSENVHLFIKSIKVETGST